MSNKTAFLRGTKRGIAGAQREKFMQHVPGLCKSPKWPSKPGTGSGRCVLFRVEKQNRQKRKHREEYSRRRSVNWDKSPGEGQFMGIVFLDQNIDFTLLVNGFRVHLDLGEQKDASAQPSPEGGHGPEVKDGHLRAMDSGRWNSFRRMFSLLLNSDTQYCAWNLELPFLKRSGRSRWHMPMVGRCFEIFLRTSEGFMFCRYDP